MCDAWEEPGKGGVGVVSNERDVLRHPQLFLCEELLHCHVEWHLVDDESRRRRYAEERR